MKARDFSDLADSLGDVTLDQAADLVRMARGGDLHHIDGPLIQALADLADHGDATLYGCSITRQAGGYRVTRGGRYRDADSAIFAAVEAMQARIPGRLGYWPLLTGEAA